MLRPAGTEHPLDWGAIAADLAAAGHKLGPEPPRQFRGGVANLNFLVYVDGHPAVLRTPPVPHAGDPRREARVLRALAGAFPLAPRVLHLGTEPAPYLLTEFRGGVAVGAALPPGLSGAALTRTHLATMAALHALDTEELGLGDFGRPDSFLTRQVEGWARRAVAVWPEGVPPAVLGILDVLRAGQPALQRVSLLHGDFKFDNVLVDPATGTPQAVIDWELAARGDPLFDLAVLLSYWIEPGDPTALHALRQVPSLTPGFPTRREVVASYGAAPDLSFHLTLARLRLAVAWMQLARGWERGALSDPAYAGFAPLATAMIDWTADTLSNPPL